MAAVNITHLAGELVNRSQHDDRIVNLLYSIMFDLMNENHEVNLRELNSQLIAYARRLNEIAEKTQHLIASISRG